MNIYVRIPYYSDKRLPLLKSCLGKIRLNCAKTSSIRFKAQYDVNDTESYCNSKDKTVVLCNSFVVYYFSYSGCGANYIDKTERKLYERTIEHAWTDKNSVLRNHLIDWAGGQHLFVLHLCIRNCLRHNHLPKAVTNFN